MIKTNRKKKKKLGIFKNLSMLCNKYPLFVLEHCIQQQACPPVVHYILNVGIFHIY